MVPPLKLLGLLLGRSRTKIPLFSQNTMGMGQRPVSYTHLLVQDRLTENQLPVYAGLNNVKFRSPVRPGDLVQTRCVLRRSKHPFYFAEGTVSVGDRLCVSAELSFAITGE